MNKRSITIIFLILACILTAYTMRLYAIYDYKPKISKVSKGELEFLLNGDYVDNDSSSIKSTTKGNPYYLLIRYSSKEEINNVKLTSIKIRGTTKAGKNFDYFEAKNIKGNIYDDVTGTRTIAFLCENLIIKFEDIEITGKIETFSVIGQREIINFSVILQKDFKMEIRNVILDGFMSA